MNKQEAIKKINSIKSRETFMSEIIWIPKQKVLDIVDQIDESQKVMVPKFVAEWIEECKTKKRSLWRALEGDSDEVNDWLDETGNEELFALAWIYGYEVEKEQLYTVEIPNPNNTSPKYKLMLVKGISGVEILRDYYTEKRDRYIFQLTESEIRKDFEWAWQAGFAKEVE
ncbi:DUF1642 domain-containing protein [Streptococcus ruminantium]|uniref:DUF1642 domain-containing protein n=1 Tax=Streptococcus ruminantium TaxID=1917441 RepID=UPI0012DDDAA2|nr:DUF1642 domain-containing protein [Streptococcus ruminantium]